MATRRISADERKWRAQDALRTLTEADRIRNDKTLMSDVRKHATQQISTLSKVAKGQTKSPTKK